VTPYLFYVVEHIHNILRQKTKKVAKKLKILLKKMEDKPLKRKPL